MQLTSDMFDLRRLGEILQHDYRASSFIWSSCSGDIRGRIAAADFL
jgi:hypothetical protein